MTEAAETVTAAAVMNTTSVIPNNITKTPLELTELSTTVIRQGGNSPPTFPRDTQARGTTGQTPSSSGTRGTSSSWSGAASSRWTSRSGSATLCTGPAPGWRSCGAPGSMTPPGNPWTASTPTGSRPSTSSGSSVTRWPTTSGTPGRR